MDAYFYKMSIELNAFDLKAKFVKDSQIEQFVIAYVKDRFSVCALCSYSRKTKVYFYVVEPDKLQYFDYLTFGNLVFRRFEIEKIFSYYFLDPPFRKISLSIVVQILDNLNVNYKVDNIGIFCEVS